MGNCSERGTFEKVSSEVSANETNFLEGPEALDLHRIDSASPELLQDLLEQTTLAWDFYQRRLTQVTATQYKTYSFEIQQLTSLADSCCCFTGDVFVKVDLLPGGPNFETSAVPPASPVWNRSFQFVSISLFEAVQVKVFMKSRWGSNRVLGSLVFSRHDLSNQRLRQGWFAVGKFKGVELQLALRIQILTDQRVLLSQFIEDLEEWRNLIHSKLAQTS